MGKILGLDIGNKRIGVSITDSSKALALAYDTLLTEEFDNRIKKIIMEEQVEEIVIGYPRNMDGTVGHQAELVKKFAEKSLRFFSGKILYQDETATSLVATENLKEQGIDPRKNPQAIDAEAARIILSDYIENKEQGC